MLLSLSWLREFVDLGDRSPERIAHDLTMKTALIEGILDRGRFDRGMVVGKVLTKTRHPGADKLSVCEVDVGRGAPLSVVCGAPNVAVGQIVAVATPGSKLPSGVEIRTAKLRGVESNGMICSEQELGLSEDHSGILVLEDELVAGVPLVDVRTMADQVLEIDNKSITHRPDLWCHEGFARELAAIYQTTYRRAVIDEKLATGKGRFGVSIEAPDLCGRYALLTVSGAVGGASPAWMQRRLLHCGLRPRSLLVDVSNYMLLEIGQPTHPFDAEKLRGDAIRIRRATAGERLVTLDDAARDLPEGGLVIADASGAIAIAGVMGGASTSISSDTRTAVIESAWFEPISVRRTANAVALRTDASSRFEKNLDPSLAERGIRRFAALLREIAPAVQVESNFVLTGDRTPRTPTLSVRPERICRKLGIEVSRDSMVDVMRRLEFVVTDRGETLDVTVPTFRATRDVLGEDDVVEEVGRMIGYERVALALPRAATAAVEVEPVNAGWRAASQLLRDQEAFAEVLSYPYAEDAYLERAGGAEDAPYIEIRNPLQQSARRLRRSLIPALVEFVDRNIRQVEEVRLFECGKVFLPKAEDRDLPYEPQMLAAVLGQRSTRKDAAGGSLRRLKGTLESLAERIERAVGFEPLGVTGGAVPRWIHPGRASRVIVGGRPLGVLAEIHPAIVGGITKTGEIAAFEIDLTAWIGSARETKPYRAVPKYPSVAIDLSFVSPFALPYRDVESSLLGVGAAAGLLSRIDFVDEYFAAPIEAGTRSLTIRLTFRSDERTLAASEVQVEVDKARAALAKLGVELRS